MNEKKRKPQRAALRDRQEHKTLMNKDKIMSQARSRTTSITLTDPEQVDHLCKSFNYQKTIRLLDLYYGIVKRKILRYQSPTTGLFPSVSDNAVEGSVRDSIYCAASVWSLFQAYRRIDNDRGKSYELGQSAVKCMRGILFCWLNQTSLVESFKKNQVPELALHSKFNLETGEPIVSSEEYGHLQIDIPSLYLIYLVQMITSGLQIIYSMDEVCFIQNLVYYIERAYRTPDFGMWERGTKYNNGTPEIHASSIGMVKAALETINGCNLFGERGTAWSVVYVDIDAHNRNRSIFETLLPRESSSKNTDAALLAAISFPAFATHDDTLYSDTKEKIIRKLKGEYGFKRFLRDGYGTVLEDKNKRFYKADELKHFEGIECEWPLFYIYLVIDGVFKNLPDQVAEYQKLLHDKLCHDHHEDSLVPMYYYVPDDCVSFEKVHPGSNPRSPSNEGSQSDRIFLWGQSLYVISQLIVENLLHINELDPIRRYLPSFCRPRRTGRYSAFQGTATDLVVQIVLIAESMRLQAMMATYGIQTQTPHEVEPIQIWSHSQLVKAYRYLGVNGKLGLSGRPPRPVGSLGTSKIYRLLGQTVLCYPLSFEIGDFYLSHDMSLLIDDIKNELHFVGHYWRLSGRPTVCLLIREDQMRDVNFNEMINLLAMIKNGSINSLKVQLGRVQNLIASSCVEHLDFLNSSKISVETEFEHFEQLKHQSAGYQSLTDIPRAVTAVEIKPDFSDHKDRPTEELLQLLSCQETMYGQSQILGIILERHGPKEMVDRAFTVKTRLEKLCAESGEGRNWQVVRYCSSLLRKLVDSISPFITAILVNGKQISLGMFGEKEILISRPINPGEAKQIVYGNIKDPYQAALQQEILLYVGKLILTQPSLFSGILKLRIGWIIHAVHLYMANFCNEMEALESLSPSAVRKLVIEVLNVNEWRKHRNCTALIQRQIEGALGRVPGEFYNRVWGIMSKAPGGIILAGHHLPQQPTISNMTMQEIDFSLMIEEMLNRIREPDHRQVIVELIIVVSVILERNPEVIVEGTIDTDMIVDDANKLYKNDHKDDDFTIDFYSTSPTITSRYLARSVVNFILKEGSATVQHTSCDVM